MRVTSCHVLCRYADGGTLQGGFIAMYRTLKELEDKAAEEHQEICHTLWLVFLKHVKLAIQAMLKVCYLPCILQCIFNLLKLDIVKLCKVAASGAARLILQC